MMCKKRMHARRLIWGFTSIRDAFIAYELHLHAGQKLLANKNTLASILIMPFF